MTLPVFRVMAVSALAAMLLSGCSLFHHMSPAPANCPDASILVGTSVLPAFASGAIPDPSAEVYRVALTGVKTRCSIGKKTRVTNSKLEISFRATRAPNGQAAQYRVPYYVALTSGDSVLEKQIHWADFAFRAGSPVSDFTAGVASVVLHIPKGKTAYDYHLLVGFQLTEAQLDYLKKQRPYTP